MNKENILKDLLTNNSNGYKTREKTFLKNYPIDYQSIVKIKFTDNWYEKLYCYLHDIDDKPKCEICGCNVNFNRFTKGYYSYCSIICRNKDDNLKLFGDKNPMKNNDNIKKSKKTKFIKYGSENYVNSIKIKETKKRKYNNENYNNRNQAMETNIIRYGDANYTNRNQAKETSLIKHGSEYYNNPDKRHRTNYNRYGVKIFNNREKAKDTCMSLYGVPSHTQSKTYKLNIFNKTIENWINRLKITGNDLKYDGDDFIIFNLCDKHKSFKINKYVLRNRLNYSISDICTICNPISDNASIKEREINDFINDELRFQTQKIKINNKEIDVYINDFNLGIEFNGLYWHSDMFLENNYHLNNTEICEENGIQLLHIFENEWIFKKEIIKSIIRNKLKLTKFKIFARKCVVRELNSSESREFLNKNHIQGSVNSSIKLGLFYNGELVSIMTFGKNRIVTGANPNNSNEYELLRYCSKLNTSVVGGASKLLKTFINKYKPLKITTYSDRRFSTGDLYIKLGFKFIKKTIPNYWYFKTGELVLHHRFKYRKNILVDKYKQSKNKTENQIMKDLGYYRIYDSGHKKFELILE